MSMQEMDAGQILQAILRRYNLEGLSEWAWGRVTAGASAAQVELELRDTEQFKTRFRAIVEREKRGLPAISPEEVIEYERRRSATLRAYGFPPGFYDSPDDAAEGLINDVSVEQIEERAAMWVDFAESSTAPETLAELDRLYGVGAGGVAAFLMDEEKAMPLLRRQVGAVDVAARARRSGFGALSVAEAERVGESVGGEDASQRFAALNDAAGALGRRLGDQTEGLDRGTLIDAAAGDPTAERAASRRIDRARSDFEGSGQSAGRGGFGGLGAV